MGLNLSFLGGVGTVTGSKFLVEDERHRLLVDCGLFQGFKALRLKNWAPFPAEPSTIDAVILTHAHLDHSGYLPLLIQRGFRGPVYCSRATVDLCAILLTDAGHLQEKDAEYANRRKFSKHRPALPLYTVPDAERALARLAGVPFDRDHRLPAGASMRLHRAGNMAFGERLIAPAGLRKIVPAIEDDEVGGPKVRSELGGLDQRRECEHGVLRSLGLRVTGEPDCLAPEHRRACAHFRWHSG